MGRLQTGHSTPATILQEGVVMWRNACSESDHTSHQRPLRAKPVEKLSATLSRMRATTRREFVGQCTGVTVGTLLLPNLMKAAGSEPSVQFPTDPKKRVAVAAYPFREFIVGWMGWDGKTPSPVPRAQQMELKDFAAHALPCGSDVAGSQ